MNPAIYQDAIQSLKSGGVIIYPSDTLWALGCDARFDKSIEKLFEIKQRPIDKGLIVLISKIEQLNEYVEQVPDIAWDLLEFAEDPLTVIYPKGKNVSKHVLGPNGSIAIRLVKDEFCKGLLFRYQRAIISTSVNLSGEPSAKTLEDIVPEIRTKVDYVLQPESGHKLTQKASKIVELGLGGEFRIIRK